MRRKSLLYWRSHDPTIVYRQRQKGRLNVDPSHSYNCGIPASPRRAGEGRTRPGLTASPQADTASPAAKMFFAAFTSRSWTAPHSGHVHWRYRAKVSRAHAHRREHRLLLGYHLSIATSVRPYHSALYVQLAHELAPADIVNGLAPASDASTIAFTRKLSTQIVWFSRMMRVESLCSEIAATVGNAGVDTSHLAWRALSRFLEPSCFLARRRCAFANRSHLGERSVDCPPSRQCPARPYHASPDQCPPVRQQWRQCAQCSSSTRRLMK